MQSWHLKVLWRLCLSLYLFHDKCSSWNDGSGVSNRHHTIVVKIPISAISSKGSLLPCSKRANNTGKSSMSSLSHAFFCQCEEQLPSHQNYEQQQNCVHQMECVIMWHMRRSWDCVVITAAQVITFSHRGTFFVTEIKEIWPWYKLMPRRHIQHKWI